MEMTSGKTIGVFVIIFGCFAVLYPKIFHPMFVHLFSNPPNKLQQDDIMGKMPPHLRKGPGGGHALHGADGHMRPGPHPGLRAAAELKKQAAQQGRDGGGGKGMMGVVLPMYAIGIVIYLIYTLSKVFGKEKDKDTPTPDYLGGNNPFNDIRYDAEERKFVQSHNFDKEDLRDDLRGLSQSKQKQRDLERLLLKADERNISEREMYALKKRLLETEEQMTRILRAMETVQSNVNLGSETLDTQAAKKEVPNVDSSPDMDSYEVISGKSNMSSPSIEDLGAAGNDLFEDKPEKDQSKRGADSDSSIKNKGDTKVQAVQKDDSDKCDSDTEEEAEGDDLGKSEVSDEENSPTEEDEDDVEVTLKDNTRKSEDKNHPDLRKRLPPNSKQKDDE